MAFYVHGFYDHISHSTDGDITFEIHPEYH